MEGADKVRCFRNGAVGVGVHTADGLQGHRNAQGLRLIQNLLQAGAEQGSVNIPASGIPGPAPNCADDQLCPAQLCTDRQESQHPVHSRPSPVCVRHTKAKSVHGIDPPCRQTGRFQAAVLQFAENLDPVPLIRIFYRQGKRVIAQIRRAAGAVIQ